MNEYCGDKDEALVWVSLNEYERISPFVLTFVPRLVSTNRLILHGLCDVTTVLIVL